jgi:hypothetical protein
MDKLNGYIIIYQTEDGLTKIDVKIEKFCDFEGLNEFLNNIDIIECI